MRSVTEQELKAIESQGGSVSRKHRKMPKKDKPPKPVVEAVPAPEPAPPPPPLPSQKSREPLPAPMPDPQMVGLVEAQAQAIAHNQAMFQQLGEMLKVIATSTPVPWRMHVIRSEKGFISDIDLLPKV